MKYTTRVTRIINLKSKLTNSGYEVFFQITDLKRTQHRYIHYELLKYSYNLYAHTSMGKEYHSP